MSKNSFFGKIDNNEEALKVIVDVSATFFLLAIIQLIIALFIGFPAGFALLMNAVIVGLLAIILRVYKSRVVAIILLLLSGFGLFNALVNFLMPGSSWLFLSLILTWTSIRAAKATWKFNSVDSVATASTQH